MSDNEFTKSPMLGLEDLPNQARRKSLQKGFNFTLMVAGESGLGKSTLLNSLFLTDLQVDVQGENYAKQSESTEYVDASTFEIEENGIKLKLTIVDTPGFGNSLDDSHCFIPMLDYIENQFKSYFEAEYAEYSAKRRTIEDTRVHACLYFISPLGHGLKPVDILVMEALHHRVNLIPLIAKADSLTKSEMRKKKEIIAKELSENNIKFYNTPVIESTKISDSFPLAVCGSSMSMGVNNIFTKGRLYSWGFLDVENEDYCDLKKLRRLLIIHMQDLQEETHEMLYENYRLEAIRQHCLFDFHRSCTTDECREKIKQ